ncbi:MAG: 30S ribosomal protein S19 [archaeon]
MKEFTYKGKKLEELKALTISEFANFVPSRIRRTLSRQAEEIGRFLKKCDKKNSMKKPIRTHARSLVIVPNMVGFTIHVHAGKEYFPVQITQEMFGHRLGEFTQTRRPVKHGAAGIGATRGSAFMSVK